MSGAQPKPDVVDSQGRPIPLGAILGKGGEGTVYEVRQTTVTAAKVYHKPLIQDRADKIWAMAGMRTEALAKLTSWPFDLLTIKGTGQPIGLLMPRIANRNNVHHLYGPKSRLQVFSRADWRFLVRAATNIAKAFAGVHDASCVIGDVNHGSIMVAEDMTVRLIDCDSFQVNTLARRFLCEVGIETFTPPELQGIPFKGVVRTTNSDNFGLAVMIFHLLFMGRHPFAGRYSGAGDMPIAKAIKECRFPTAPTTRRCRWTGRPVHRGCPSSGPRSLNYSRQRFRKPRKREAVQRREIGPLDCRSSRPTPRSAPTTRRTGTRPISQHAHGARWRPRAPTHSSRSSSRQRPAARSSTFRRFGGRSRASATSGSAPPIPMPSASPSPAALQVGRPNPLANPISWVVGLGVFIGGTVMLPALFCIFAIVGVVAYNFVLKQFSNAEHVERFRKVVSDAETNFSRADSDWQHRAGGGAFYDAKRKFDALRTELSGIPTKRIRALDQLKQDQHTLQLGRFLDRFELEDAKIEGVGPGRKRTLGSYGIETAEDIVPHRLYAVPGFGPKMIERLMKWRRSIEAKFVLTRQRRSTHATSLGSSRIS